MTLLNLDRAKLKQILKDSQGFPAQSDFAKARVVAGQQGNILQPAAAGHALSSHLSGVAATPPKTKFCSLEAMAEALFMVLQTPQGVQALNALSVKAQNRKVPADSIREPIEVSVLRAFDVEVEWGQRPRTLIRRFSAHELTQWGIHQTTCVAVLEVRARSNDSHLHVQTFFPKLSHQQARLLFDRLTTP